MSTHAKHWSLDSLKCHVEQVTAIICIRLNLFTATVTKKRIQLHYWTPQLQRIKKKKDEAKRLGLQRLKKRLRRTFCSLKRTLLRRCQAKMPSCECLSDRGESQQQG